MVLAEIWSRYPEVLEGKLVKLIGKKDGGLRAIVLFRSIFRIHSRIRQGAVREWEAERCASAKFNNAPCRRISDDVYRSWIRSYIGSAEGKWTCEILWDLKKAFENVDRAILWQKGKEHGYPLDILRLSMRSYA